MQLCVVNTIVNRFLNPPRDTSCASRIAIFTIINFLIQFSILPKGALKMMLSNFRSMTMERSTKAGNRYRRFEYTFRKINHGNAKWQSLSVIHADVICSLLDTLELPTVKQNIPVT